MNARRDPPDTYCPKHPYHAAIYPWRAERLCVICYGRATRTTIFRDEEAQEQIGKLIGFTLNHIWAQHPGSALDLRSAAATGCCPICCPGCCVLGELVQLRDLDYWARVSLEHMVCSPWWDQENERVDRMWLGFAWGHATSQACSQAHTLAQTRQIVSIITLLFESVDPDEL